MDKLGIQEIEIAQEKMKSKNRYMLCHEIFWAFAALRCLPVDILCRDLDIAGFAMDTARRMLVSGVKTQFKRT